MKIPLLIFISAIAFALSGCYSVSHRQFVIHNAESTDEKAVVNILATAANTAGLKDVTSKSSIPKTLAFYFGLSQPFQQNFTIRLASWINNEDIIIDLSVGYPGAKWSVPQAYKKADSVLMDELPKYFDSMIVIDPESRVPFPNPEEKTASQ